MYEKTPVSIRGNNKRLPICGICILSSWRGTGKAEILDFVYFIFERNKN
jgi:hypothetical protein